VDRGKAGNCVASQGGNGNLYIPHPTLECPLSEMGKLLAYSFLNIVHWPGFVYKLKYTFSFFLKTTFGEKEGHYEKID